MNNKYCEVCKDVFQIEEYDEHLKNHNKPKPQVDIKKPEPKVDPKPLPNLQRLESAKWECRYCTLTISQSEQRDHEAMCGARSTKCEYCDKNMLYKDIPVHLIKCSARMQIEGGGVPFENDFEMVDDVHTISKKIQLDEDENMARLLAKGSFNNEELAKMLAKDKEEDEKLAKMLAKEDTKEDEKIARLLEKGSFNVNDDAEAARRLQMELDERLAQE
jgi:hypothetical protein